MTDLNPEIPPVIVENVTPEGIIIEEVAAVVETNNPSDTGSQGKPTITERLTSIVTSDDNRSRTIRATSDAERVRAGEFYHANVRLMTAQTSTMLTTGGHGLSDSEGLKRGSVAFKLSPQAVANILRDENQ